MIELTFTPEGVLQAYRHGIFPMADEVTGQISWYLPDPRTILPLDRFHVSHSLARTIRSDRFELRIDSAFTEVMRACADRPEGSWISEEFVELYTELHRQGAAHSVETWREGKLVGGLYGVAVAGAFMGESMFHHETDASKVALAALVDRLKERGFILLDTQYPSSHLDTLGATLVPARTYERLLKAALKQECRFGEG